MGRAVTVIRSFAVGDIPRAAELERERGRSHWTEGVFRDELAAEDRIYLVAEGDGVLGYGGVMIVGEEAHVTNLLVAGDRRGEGIGRRLLVELIRSAVTAGARHLTLEVRVGNEAARSLYASLGMAPVGVRPGYYGDEDALILWAHDIDRPEYLEELEPYRGTGYGVRSTGFPSGAGG
jgi:ribosomal-protein-alanine N-acetyltransferase